MPNREATTTIAAGTHSKSSSCLGGDACPDVEALQLDVVLSHVTVARVTGAADPIYGRDAHGGAMKELVRMFPDSASTPRTVQFGSGDWITVVTNVTGTILAELKLPDGTVIAPTGKAFDADSELCAFEPAHRLVRSARRRTALRAVTVHRVHERILNLILGCAARAAAAQHSHTPTPGPRPPRTAVDLAAAARADLISTTILALSG